MKLIFETVTRIVRPQSVGRPALNHEVRDHTMKDEVVKKRTVRNFVHGVVDETFRSVGQPYEVRDSPWNEGVFQTTVKNAFARIKPCVKAIVHWLGLNLDGRTAQQAGQQTDAPP